MACPLDLTGKTVLVTGASSGIGRATAIRLSQSGARVVLVGRDRANLEETCSRLDGPGHPIEPFDLNQVDEIPGWMKALSEKIGPFRGVVHCAGVQLLSPLRMVKASQIEDLFRINVVSAILLAKGFRQRGIHDAGASVVFVSSVMGEVGSPGRTAYCASKSALHALTKALAVELAREDIRVNCVAPGFVETPILEQARAQMGEAQMAELEALHPLGFGRPLDVAHAILYLLADTARWITGSIQMVDGGYTAQ